MPRTFFCIFCAALAAAMALMILLFPSPAQAQQLPSAVTLGDGDKTAGEIRGRVLLLGTEAPQPGFKLLVMARNHDRSNPTRELLTDEKGAFSITLKNKPVELRVFAFGDWYIPDAWSNIPLARMKFEAPETWDVRVRPLRKVRVRGTVKIAPGNTAAPRANVMMAPLDVAQDGTSQLFDQPIGTLTDEQGNFSFDLPTGYYMVWAYWADRSKDDWVGHIQVISRVEVFGDQTLSLALKEGPILRGKVVDARTGNGIPASISLYTNQYLRQLRLSAGDGEMADEYLPDGTEVVWPIGTFKFRAWLVDPENFTVVIRPSHTETVMKILPNLKASDLVGKELTWTLYDEGVPALDVQVTTHKHDLPINQLDVQLLPKDVDVPPALKLSLNAGGLTDNEGKVRFMGLPRGTYEVYGSQGSNLLGTIKVTGAAQVEKLKFEIPFVFGKVKLADGTVCRHVVAFVTLVNADGRSFGPYPSDAFRKNPVLSEKGTVFVPLTQRGVTFKVRYAAFEDGRAFKDEDWVNINDFPLVTDETSYKVETEEAWETDQTLKPNPDYKKPD
ncbi:MAG: hypothetical protein HS108_15200 [Planctomycetes bacterium]|jgi:hypothetical protein|nr:hypothetical protein [Planctomycetota bacterium]MCL4730337.1 hypothetical protein [Planctomycetota bacterium]